MNTLKIGMRGPEVERWQAFLIKAGFLSGGADGSFGPATYDATVKFQQSKGLTPDGVAGPRTLSYLTAETGVTEPPPQDQTPVVLTETLLKQIMPGLRPADCTAYLPFLQQAMVEFGISTRARAAAFLAQLAHESGQFKWMEEIWGPTAQQQRYEPTTRAPMHAMGPSRRAPLDDHGLDCPRIHHDQLDRFLPDLRGFLE